MRERLVVVQNARPDSIQEIESIIIYTNGQIRGFTLFEMSCVDSVVWVTRPDVAMAIKRFIIEHNNLHK